MRKQFKVGDRVEVVAPADGSGWPGGSDGGRFFRVGNTGTVIDPDPVSTVVRFDDQEGVNPNCDREWNVDPACLRALSRHDLTLSRRPRLIDRLLAKFPRLRALSGGAR